MRNANKTIKKGVINASSEVTLCITGINSGCYALARVTSEPKIILHSKDEHLWKTEDKSTLKAQIEITHNLSDNPILYNEIKAVEELDELKIGNQGTNFTATEEEYNSVVDLIESRNSIKYWVYAPGANADHWEDFYFNGIMALGWDDLGDLNSYNTKEEIAVELRKLDNSTGSKKNDASACFNFKNVIKKGDVVFVKKGLSEFLGYGIVSSSYYFDDTREDFKHCRKIEWKRKGNWKVERSIVLKTLTDITQYKDYIIELKNLFNMNGRISPEKIEELFRKYIFTKTTESNSIDYLSRLRSFSTKIIDRGLSKVNIYEMYLPEELKSFRLKVESDKDLFTNNSVQTALNYYEDFCNELHAGTIANNDNEYINTGNTMNNQPLNIILYGPPGTGKTYHSIDKAVEIAEGKSMGDHSKNKIEFDQLRKEGQIEFVTFHQNYSYEDFMVGLKPDIENELLRFKQHKGIFYEISKRASDNYFASKQGTSLARSFDDVLNEIVKPCVELGKDVEITMASGIAYKINDVSDYTIHFKKAKGDSLHSLSIQTIENIVDGKRKSPRGLEPYYNPLVDKIKEMMKPKEGTKTEVLKNFVLVIDEINRANISKVFGELITLLEDDKRIGSENELRITLPNGEKDFGVPPNLYVVGTMNTADKSIALIDIALRRRFEFIGKYPQYDGIGLIPEQAELLKQINSSVFEKKKSTDYLIGHAYFMKGLPTEKVLENKIIPLLMEYLSGKTDIVSSVFEGSAWQVKYDISKYTWEITKK